MTIDKTARVTGDARVDGDAKVSDSAMVTGDARVDGDAKVSDSAMVTGDARVSGDARVDGDAKVTSVRGITHGAFDLYAWTAFYDEQLGLVLRFGCERRTVADWMEHVKTVCMKYEPANVERYVTAIRAIIQLAQLLDVPETKDN